MKEAKKVAVPTPHDSIMLEILSDIMTAKRPSSSKMKIFDLVHFIKEEYKIRLRRRRCGRGKGNPQAAPLAPARGGSIAKKDQNIAMEEEQTGLFPPEQWGEYMEEPY